MSMTREEASYELERLLRHWDDLENDKRCFWGYDQEAVEIALTALRPVSWEKVEKVWRGEWKHYLPPLGAGDVQCRCTRCGRTPDVETPFCAYCGAPMTDEAVQMVMERLEAMKDGNSVKR